MVKFDRSRYEQVQKQLDSGASGGSIAKLRDGRNYIRLYPFSHKVTQADIKSGAFRRDRGIKAGKTIVHLEREVAVHYRADGPAVNCTLMTDCPACAEARSLMNGSAQEQQLGKRLRARNQFYVNAVVLQHDREPVPDNERKMSIISLPYAVFNELVNYLVDPDYDPEEIMGGEARDIIIDRNSKATPDKMYRVRLAKEGRSAELDVALEEGVQDLYAMDMLNPGWSSDPAAALSQAQADEHVESEDESEEEEEVEEELDEEEEFEEEEFEEDDVDEEEHDEAEEEAEDDVDEEAEDDVDEEEHDEAEDDGGDEDGSDDAALWLGKKVTFEDEGEVITGDVTEVYDDGQIVVTDADDNEWVAQPDEVKEVKSRASRKKTSKKTTSKKTASKKKTSKRRTKKS